MKHLHKQYKHYFKKITKGGTALSDDELQHTWLLIYNLVDEGVYRKNYDAISMGVVLFDRLIEKLDIGDKDYIRKMSKQIDKIENMLSRLENAATDDITENIWNREQQLIMRMSFIGFSD